MCFILNRKFTSLEFTTCVRYFLVTICFVYKSNRTFSAIGQPLLTTNNIAYVKCPLKQVCQSTSITFELNPLSENQIVSFVIRNIGFGYW